MNRFGEDGKSSGAGLIRMAVWAVALWVGSAPAFGQSAKVSETKHNLSANSTKIDTSAASASNPGGGGNKSASTASGGTTEICVFCHTPHAANTAAPAPLWNRSHDSGQTYTVYTSESLDAEDIKTSGIDQPGVTSKLCLSCHDGTLAIGSVSNAPGSGGLNTEIPMTGGTGSKIGAGVGETTGFTRRLGANLTNDHPISVTFNATLALRDGELRSPPYSSGATLIVDTKANKPKLPLDSNNQVQCTTCHEPHFNEPKFLRGKRLQASPASGGDYVNQSDQICLACHSRLGTAWSNSAHAKGTSGGGALDVNPGNNVYSAAAATLREFPAGTMVWQAGCLNCHDTHTVQGARRLLREGTDGSGTPRAGGNPALENTCYQCHTSSPAAGTSTLTSNTGVPNIETEFGRAVHMPISSGEQPAASERHAIGGGFSTETYKSATIDCSNATNKCGADFVEQRSNLGADNTTNRHAECTDCHNPHRVIKNSRVTGDGVNQRTHRAGNQNATLPLTPPTSSALDGNVASGALRGAWGVEPGYSVGVATVWDPRPGVAAGVNSFTVKRGDPGTSTSVAKTESYLTREYQLCFKCHSDYGFGDTPRSLTGSNGSTSPSANSYNGTNANAYYTNQAAEFAASATEYSGNLASLDGTHQCEASGDDSCTPIGASWDVTANASTINHRSWHPVVFPTGRTATERGGTNNNFRTPFTNLGIQTMHCSDCHGHNATWTQGTGPALNTVQGPHGSSNSFLLRSAWSPTGATPGSPQFCGNCHNPGGASATGSGWGGNSTMGHSGGSTQHGSDYCGRCHVALPHGWKNKAFLVNLNCVGREASGNNSDCSDSVVGNTSTMTRGPYYVGASLRISTWRASRQWTETSCGPRGGGGGKNWMTDTC